VVPEQFPIQETRERLGSFAGFSFLPRPFHFLRHIDYPQPAFLGHQFSGAALVALQPNAMKIW